jgi:hypothetical protein
MIPEWYGNLAQAALPATGRNLPLPTVAAQFTENADFVNVVGMHVRGRPAIEAQHVAISQDRVSQ